MHKGILYIMWWHDGATMATGVKKNNEFGERGPMGKLARASAKSTTPARAGFFVRASLHFNVAASNFNLQRMEGGEGGTRMMEGEVGRRKVIKT